MTDSILIRCLRCDTTNRVPADRLHEHPRCGRCHEALFNGRPLELEESTFDKHVTTDSIPLLVDFWAPWCRPCLQMAPAFVEAASLLEPNMRLAKINTEAAPRLAERFGIRSIPTLIVFRQGRESARQPGALSKQGIVSWARAAIE